MRPSAKRWRCGWPAAALALLCQVLAALPAMPASAALAPALGVICHAGGTPRDPAPAHHPAGCALCPACLAASPALAAAPPALPLPRPAQWLVHPLPTRATPARATRWFATQPRAPPAPT